VATGVEHENGIVLYGFDQETDLILGLPQCRPVLEHKGFLLSLGNRAKALFLTGKPPVVFRREYRRVFAADFEEWINVIRVIEARHWIGAQKRKRISLRQIIPELPDLYCFLRPSRRPQQGDKFTERGEMKGPTAGNSAPPRVSSLLHAFHSARFHTFE
jgi:hypothetical protein